jgi:hypothetical protein
MLDGDVIVLDQRAGIEGIAGHSEPVLSVCDDVLSQGTGDLCEGLTNLFDGGRVPTLLPGAGRDEHVVGPIKGI